MDPFIWVHKFSYLEQLIQICNRIASYAFVADINILPKDMRVCGDNAKEGLKKKKWLLYCFLAAPMGEELKWEIVDEESTSLSLFLSSLISFFFSHTCIQCLMTPLAYILNVTNIYCFTT